MSYTGSPERGFEHESRNKSTKKDIDRSSTNFFPYTPLKINVYVLYLLYNIHKCQPTSKTAVLLYELERQ